MSTQVQRRKGTTAQHASFTGASAELTVDTTKNTVIVHDGATAGGIPLAKETGSAISATSLSGPLTGTVGATTANTGNFTDLTFSGTGTISGGTANGVPYLNGSKQVTTGTALTFDGTNLGVGITNPGGYKLNLRTAPATSGLDGAYISDGTRIIIVGQSGATYNYASIAANENVIYSSANPLNIVADGQVIKFSTGAEGMRLTSTGLGIGTSSPGAKLEVAGAAPTIKITANNATQASLQLTQEGVGNWLKYFRVSDSAFVEQFGGTDLLFLSTAGNLGLGVTPSATIWSGDETRLVVKGSGSSYAGTIAVQSKGTTNAVTGYFVANDIINTVAFGAKTNTPLVFCTNDTERARIDSSGNLGIGTTSPSTSLGGARGLVLGGSPDVQIRLQNSTSGTSSSDGVLLSINSALDGYLWNYENANFVFGTNNTERARIDSSGNLLVGTTTLSYANANNVMVQPQYGRIYYQHNSSTPSGTAYAEFVYNGGVIGSITQNGTTGVLYNTSSDYRLKNITGHITTSGAYIDSLKPVEGTWKADGSTFVGLIAHETQEVSRTTVATGTKDGEEMQGMDYSSAEIIANLIAEIQSLRKRVAALEPEPFASYEQFGIPKP